MIPYSLRGRAGMIRLLYILLSFGMVGAANADFRITKSYNCLFKCRIDRTNNCASLSYYMGNCSKCGTVSKQCSKAFCQNHPNNCDANRPLKDLSINTMDVKDNGVVLDICIAKLFPPLEFEKQGNGDLNIVNLNMLDFAFYSQTGGAALERNIGTLRKLIANYLVYKDGEINRVIPNLSVYVDQWVIATFHKHLRDLTPFDFHMISEFVRRDLYVLKGIKIQTKTEIFEGQKYPMTVSKLGCKGEAELDPIVSNPSALYSIKKK